MVISELSDEGRASQAKTSGSTAVLADGLEEGEVRNVVDRGENVEDHPWENEPFTPMHEVHGNQERGSFNMAAEVTKQNSDVGGFRSKRNTVVENQEPNKDLGPGPNTKSRKRPRRTRSLQMSSPDAYIREDPPQTHIRNLERSFELNNEMIPEDVSHGCNSKPDNNFYKVDGDRNGD
ncbi:hypothetical protein Hanom_Chr07g00674321 [Helianthus anomalus]